MLVAMSEEMQVATEVQDVSQREGNSMMGESLRDKVLRPQTLNVFCFCCNIACLLMLSLVFGMV